MHLSRTDRFDLIEDAYREAQADASTVRADSKGRDLDVSGILWGRYLTRVRGQRADAMRAGLASRLSSVAFRGANAMDVRADSAHFFALDLVDRAERITVRPQRPNALLAGIPVDPVTPWAKSCTAKFGEDSGVAIPWTKGSTETRLVDYSVTEEERQMMLFRIDTRDVIGDDEERALAGLDFGSPAEQMRRALEAHYKAHNAGLLSGVTGFSGYHLGNLPGILRRVSTTTYGSTAADTAPAEIKVVLQQIPEQAGQTMPAPDTAIISPRLWNRLGSYINFAGGGSAFSEEMVRTLLSDRGIRNIVMAAELQDYGASLTDAMLLFNGSDPDSLKQKIGLRPAPVKTFDNGPALSRQTAVLSGFGGLYAAKGGSVLLYTASVTA